VRKTYFYAVVGAGLLLAGCNSDPIMGNHKYQPIPVDDPVNITTENQTETLPPAQPAPQPAFKYAPMTGVTSSGGVDSVPGKKAKKAAKAGNTVAPGGTYTIQRGDTPERIARKHNVRLKDLMAANNLDEAKARRLQIGQKLTIPGRGGAAAPVISKKNNTVKGGSSSNTPALENGKYKVQRGDSPERIARRFKVKLKDLLAVNNLDEAKSRRLQIGQQLIIPGRNAEPAPVVKPEVVKVQGPEKKDVADKKAEAEGTKINPQPAPTPTPSDPATPESDEGDYDTLEAEEDTTYAALAAKYGTTEAKLREINAASPSATIKKGDWLLVPKK